MKKTVIAVIFLLFLVAGALDVASTYLCLEPRTVFVERSWNTTEYEYTNGGTEIEVGLERNPFFVPFAAPVMFGVIIAVFNLKVFAGLNKWVKGGVTVWFLVLSFSPAINNFAMLMA